MSSASRDNGYLLNNQQAEAGMRFDALSTLFNPSTFRHIKDLGIQRGWRCWEVGAGSPSVPKQQLANKIRFGFRKMLAQRGADLSYGRKLPRLLREAGLTDVNADAFFPITSPACNLLETATVNQVREGLIANGYATAEEIDLHLANIATGQLDLATSPMISAWGRRL